jgi:hypothetical protein
VGAVLAAPPLRLGTVVVVDVGGGDGPNVANGMIDGSLMNPITWAARKRPAPRFPASQLNHPLLSRHTLCTNTGCGEVTQNGWGGRKTPGPAPVATPPPGQVANAAQRHPAFT